MADFGENTQGNPFEIIDARQAQHQASVNQRQHSNEIAKAHGALADAEYTYRTALTNRWKQLKEKEGWAATVCGNIARGEESIATLRRERDKRKGDLEELLQDAYRIAADRRALEGLIDWSMRRDLRVDTPPLEWGRPEGAGVPAGVDSRTGELRPVA